MDPETKKARETAKSEQWETERKKASKYLIPKYYYASEHWNLSDESIQNNRYLKQFDRLKVILNLLFNELYFFNLFLILFLLLTLR